jgi:3-methyladenine DNA glycosylase/8-oxoguanine DNA glycosylase
VNGLTFDLREAEHTLAAADAALATVIARWGPCTLALDPIVDPFAALLKAIVYQQLSGKAAGTIYRRVLDLAPEGHFDPRRVRSLSDEALRGAGLSRNKLAAIRDLSDKTLDGTIPAMVELAALPDDEILRRLCTVRGIGRWTVEMLLIFNLGRPDVMPSTDLGVRKGFQHMLATEELPAPSALHDYAERWRPYRSVASWYLWRIVDGEAVDWG